VLWPDYTNNPEMLDCRSLIGLRFGNEPSHECNTYYPCWPAGRFWSSGPELDSVNRFLRETEAGGGGDLVEATQYAGGPKHMESRVYLSAFNHADTEVILRAADQAPWQDRHMVQAFVKEEQEDDVFLLR
jgi:hypothetical protein